MPSDTPEQISVKTALYAEAEEAVAKLNAAADVLVSVELKGLKSRAYEIEREAGSDQMLTYWTMGLPELKEYARLRLLGRQCLHWALAYPEIMQAGGFSAFVGNPPFLHGRRVSTILGSNYLQYLKSYHEEINSSADLVAYFVLRMFFLLRARACQGLVSTQGIAEGDTRETSLDWILRQSAAIRATAKRWMKTASSPLSRSALGPRWENSTYRQSNWKAWIATLRRPPSG